MMLILRKTIGCRSSHPRRHRLSFQTFIPERVDFLLCINVSIRVSSLLRYCSSLIILELELKDFQSNLEMVLKRFQLAQGF